MKKELRTCTVQDQEGQWKEFYLIGLEGLDPYEQASVRKIEFSHYVTVKMDEEMMSAEMQLTRSQPQSWFNYTMADHTGKHRPYLKSAKNEKPVTFLSVEDWRARAEKIIAAREAAESLAFAAENPAPDGEQGDVLDDIDSEVGAKNKGPVHQQLESVDEMMGPAQNAQNAKPKKATKRKRGKGAEPEEDVESASGTGVPTLTGGVLELAKSDPDMAVVAKRHEEITKRPMAPCFAALEMSYVFKKSGKIGQAKNGAPRLQVLAAFCAI